MEKILKRNGSDGIQWGTEREKTGNRVTDTRTWTKEQEADEQKIN